MYIILTFFSGNCISGMLGLEISQMSLLGFSEFHLKLSSKFEQVHLLTESSLEGIVRVLGR